MTKVLLPAAPADAATVIINSNAGFDAGENLYPYAACVLCINSCYITKPRHLCWGVNCEITACCTTWDVQACKPSAVPDTWCTCIKLAVDCHKTTVCIKSKTQVCCLDSRAAIPPDEKEVPCMLNLAGLTCCYANAATCRCCTTLSSLETAKPE